MGKRNKHIKEVSSGEFEEVVTETTENNEQLAIKSVSMKNKRSKKKEKKILGEEGTDTDNPKKIKLNNSENSRSPESNMMKNENIFPKIINTQFTEKPKKIKFGDDGESETVYENFSNNKKVNREIRMDVNIKEEDIKDEDIDQFCEDVDEEDNKQYESWITLLEQKLGNNECKVKKMKKRENKKITE